MNGMRAMFYLLGRLATARWRWTLWFAGVVRQSCVIAPHRRAEPLGIARPRDGASPPEPIAPTEAERTEEAAPVRNSLHVEGSPSPE